MDIKKLQYYIHNRIELSRMNSGYVYKLENDVDFFKELKQIKADKMKASSLIEVAARSAETTQEPRCLITNEPLQKDHITLKCGHKFNYVPIFNEVLFQKCSLLPKNISSKLITTYTKYTGGNGNTQAINHPVASLLYNSSYNLETNKLQYDEIKCPYCRSITNNILPYYPYPDVSKVKYVNFPSNLSLPALTCEYNQFISGGNNTVFTTNEANLCKCSCIYNKKYNMMLCNKHLTKLETTSSSPHRPKTRAKVKLNQQSGDAESQNIIVSYHNPATIVSVLPGENVCTFTLLSGARKGCLCGKPAWVPKTATYANAIQDTGVPTFCKAHYSKGTTTTTLHPV